MILGTFAEPILVNDSYSLKEVRAYEKEWHQVANGEWFTVDLGPITDKKFCSITTSGAHQSMRELEEYLRSTISARLSVFDVQIDEGEDLFGVEVDYSNPLSVALIGEPSITYDSLDWSSVSFELMLNNGLAVPLVSKPSGISFSSLPMDFGVSRELFSGKKNVIYYSGVPDFVWDELKSQTNKMSFTLTRDQAIWLKRTLVDARDSVLTIDNTYFDLVHGDGTKPETVDIKIKSFSESRETLNLYRIDMEFYIHA